MVTHPGTVQLRLNRIKLVFHIRLEPLLVCKLVTVCKSCGSIQNVIGDIIVLPQTETVHHTHIHCVTYILVTVIFFTQ